MKHPIRLIFLAATSATLVACSSGGDSASSGDAASSSATTETTSSAAETSTAAATSSAAVDRNDEDLIEPLDIVTDPYTPEDLQLAKENARTFMSALYSATTTLPA